MSSKRSACLCERRDVLGLLALAATPVAGYAGQRWAEARDRGRYRMPGRLLDVNGERIHVVVDGSGPAVLLDSGLGGSNLEWAAVAADLSKDFTVVRYDRPGFGWSPPSYDAMPPPGAVARRVHGILTEIGVPLPAVLVGHSIGGIHVRLVASMFPEIVDGLVLVDPSHEDMLDSPDAARSAARTSKVMSAFALTAPLGTARVVGRLYGRLVAGQIRGTLDRNSRAAVDISVRLNACSVAGTRAAVAELKALPVLLRHAKQLSRESTANVPVTVISANAPARSRNEEAGRATIRHLHEALAALGPVSRLVLAETSGHLVPLDQPGLIAQCVRETAVARAAGTWDRSGGLLR